ncbi:MAG: DNA polymerase III subunit gamma/tau [bacterium]|nr:DNA polymerase III subunit gamma/tau [bacterium]
MSYEVLARRWRPQTFDEVYGQKHVTTALANAIRLGRMPHALLLCGPRGVGKTTLARILARALNCDQGPTEKPCGECTPCKEIAAGTSLDVQEIDAASNTGVDSVREVRESIRYAAAPGKHRIYVIDEVHMLSTAAFNALLKTLEEPPPGSLFVLATTDPQKIPATVLSRVQRFDLKRIGPAEVLERLTEIVTTDAIQIPESVLRALVREGDGSLRDALTLLDRLSSALGNQIDEADAMAILDLIDRRILADILDPVLQQDPAAALLAVRRAFDKGIEPARLAADLLASLRDLLVARLVDDSQPLIDVAPDELEELRTRARPHEPETLQRLFRVLLSRNQDLNFAPRPEQVLEMAIVRLATLPSAQALGSLIQRLEALENGGSGGSDPAGLDTRGGAPRRGGPGPRRSGASASAKPANPPPSARAVPEPPRASASSGISTTEIAEFKTAKSGAAESGAVKAEIAEPEIEEIPIPQEPPPDTYAEPVPIAPPLPRRDPEFERRLRQESKSHPLVLQMIESLDAELREIRTPRAPISGDPS